MACAKHPDRESVAQCVICHAELCEECRQLYEGKSYCAEHNPAAAAQPAQPAAPAPTAPAPTEPLPQAVPPPTAAQPPTVPPTPASPPAAAVPQPPPAAPPQQAYPQPAAVPGAVSQVAYNPGMGLLAHLLGWIGGLIVLCTDSKYNRDNRIHAWYGIFLSITFVVVVVALEMLSFIAGILTGGFGVLVSFLILPVILGWVVIKIINAVKAYNGQMPIALPVVLDQATKQADKPVAGVPTAATVPPPAGPMPQQPMPSQPPVPPAGPQVSHPPAPPTQPQPPAGAQATPPAPGTPPAAPQPPPPPSPPPQTPPQAQPKPPPAPPGPPTEPPTPQ